VREQPLDGVGRPVVELVPVDVAPPAAVATLPVVVSLPVVSLPVVSLPVATTDVVELAPSAPVVIACAPLVVNVPALPTLVVVTLLDVPPTPGGVGAVVAVASNPPVVDAPSVVATALP
jgi:hypothetical protein